MKKTYNLIHPRIQYPRMVEAAKHDIRKYIKRERRKELPEGVDFWDFACRFGPSEEEATDIHVAEISRFIDAAEAKQFPSFYVEVVATHGRRTKRPAPLSPPVESD